MRVRALDSSRDMQFGGSERDFLVNSPAAVAQCAYTRLELNVGDWFLDLTEGTPWRTEVLGKYTDSLRDPVLLARLQGTRGVDTVENYSSTVDRTGRNYFVQATLNTIYGVTLLGEHLTTPPDVDVRYGR